MAVSVDIVEDEQKERYKKISAGDRLWPRVIQPFLFKAPGVPTVKIRRGAEARSAPRLPVQIPGRVELAKGEIQDCLVIDLSPGGALIELERAATVGETIKLRLTENGEFAGTVKWCGANRMGVKFDHFGGLLPC